MTDQGTEVTTDLLEAFADAWNRHDAQALMSFMTPDCVFESSAGPDVCGTRYRGAEAVRAGFVDVWTDLSRCALGKCAPLRLRRPRPVAMDLHRYRQGRHACRGAWLRPVHFSRRQDRAEGRVPQEPSSPREPELMRIVSARCCTGRQPSSCH